MIVSRFGLRALACALAACALGAFGQAASQLPSDLDAVSLARLPYLQRKDAGESAKRLFDGKSFNGWEGNLSVFRIEDGAITGGSLKESLAHNEFLCTTDEYDDFELRVKFKLIGDPASANATAIGAGEAQVLQDAISTGEGC